MFTGSGIAREFPAYNMTGGTNLGSLLGFGIPQFYDFDAFNIGESFTIAGAQFSKATLEKIFGNLKTVSGKTITITGCPGAATCDRTIATNKGWTVAS